VESLSIFATNQENNVLVGMLVHNNTNQALPNLLKENNVCVCVYVQKCYVVKCCVYAKA